MFKDEITESSLLRNIKKKISGDSRVCNLDVFLTEVDGLIIIHGIVDKPFRKKAVLSIVKNTDGVVGVVDQVRVSQFSRFADKEIKKKADHLLDEIPLQQGEWLKTEVLNGVVRLTGSVSHSRSKARAEISAWKLSGIKDCLNLIELDESQAGQKSG